MSELAGLEQADKVFDLLQMCADPKQTPAHVQASVVFLKQLYKVILTFFSGNF